MDELLTPDQMNKADQLTICGGIAGIELMEAAGRSISTILQQKFQLARKVLIVCGCGNNGGDGFVIARLLAKSGLKVELFIAGNKDKISGDAALALKKIESDVTFVKATFAKPYDLIVDALFGAGLDRDIKGDLAEMVEAINESDTPVLAVDLPSGIDGATGAILGRAFRADITVTFFRKKPGHILYPGRGHCGELIVTQIGIRPAVLKHIGTTSRLNRPKLWRDHYPVLKSDGHKFDRGHTLVVSGELPMSGAARMSAGAALRTGSGLVTIAGSKDVLTANAASLSAIMLCEASDEDALLKVLEDQRINCIAMGPGMQPDSATRGKVLAVLSTNRHTVLDAGALSAFNDHQDELFSAINANIKSVVLTPHAGEFSRLFPDQDNVQSKITRTQTAANRSGAIIINKGPDTVIAAPDGRCSITDYAPPWLATAGSGDVLTGIVAGLLAQGMAGFEAANAAVWLHGDAANRMGAPMISSDLDEGIRWAIAGLVDDWVMG
ncbi:MAG: NAD(P)H-hydrate dehydratase [Hyphomicrobiales bacterium]|nr:NAD(P)H-hydrate dehydratase [Hyphomicrobiales bacterium]